MDEIDLMDDMDVLIRPSSPPRSISSILLSVYDGENNLRSSPTLINYGTDL